MGKPGGSHFPSRPAEHIGRAEATGGTETSKYPEEEKSNEIPLVVASERGPRTNAEAERHGKAGGTGLEPRTRIREDCLLAPEYRRTRETRWEAGGSTLQS